ncbi:C4-dicarboxylate transporter/malic acid transport protein [Penicillium cinerascens]|uniref:Sulfite efflux pump SSU1 n=1 Tax=Penicillium cinerascens TaxID=70096 RepID=A0A9W9N977_9EURO|nr:C4-dicarboxylate transporter/malic acid transport protein [Penicillium cinerascens]KAJ5215595.1 C4-dicarboxylate transporter/malic acid transport protein [Penicillium cinerascens]
MGTGIVSILLHNLPYNSVWLYWLSVIVFAFNVFLFVLFSIISFARYTLFRGLWTSMLNHPTQSLFLGTFPMGLATIINMICFVCVPAWGSWAATLAWTLWWIDVVISLANNMYLPFAIMSRHSNQLSGMTAAWLLPIVSTIVAAASGGIVASVLKNEQHALWTIIVSYILWGTGVPLAMMVLVMYFHRLTIHKLPPREVIVSVFLPLGPLGQGSFGIMQLGKEAMRVFPQTNSLPAQVAAGTVLYIVGFMVGLIMWGFALVWLFFALASIRRSKFPFNMGWWGFTFPIGVFTVSTTTLAKELPSLFFKVLGTIFSVAVVLLWVVVSVGTIIQTWQRKIFVAPCLKEWENMEAQRYARDGQVPQSV